MKIVIATPILFEKKSPFNHLFKDIIQGIIDDGNELLRIVATDDFEKKDYMMGIESQDIKYIPIMRKSANHGNIFQRYIKDNITSIKMAYKIYMQDDIDILLEDVCYSSFWAVFIAKKKKIKIVSMVQDIWPDNAVQSGILKQGSILYKYFEFWQRYVYKNSDEIICISDDMKAFISSKGINKEKINVIYNWGYGDKINDIKWEENEFVRKFSLSKDKFYAVYAGNIGRMQNVSLIIRAAEKLDCYKDIKFLIIGEGVKKEEIKKMVYEKKLKNVQFIPLQSDVLATSIYSAASVNLVPLVPNGINTALPSKTGVVLSCGKPVIFAFGESCKFKDNFSENADCVCVSSDDASALKNTILDIFNNNEKREKESVKVFSDIFVRTKNIKKYVDVIRKVSH